MLVLLVIFGECDDFGAFGDFGDCAEFGAFGEFGDVVAFVVFVDLW